MNTAHHTGPLRGSLRSVTRPREWEVGGGEGGDKCLYCGFRWKEWGRVNRFGTGQPEELQWALSHGDCPWLSAVQPGAGPGGVQWPECESPGSKVVGQCEFNQLLRKGTDWSLARPSILTESRQHLKTTVLP